MSAEVRESPITGGNRLYIDPMDNVLIGSTTILRYLGITSITTMIQWVEVWGMPCVKRPDGMWMTTMTAIDQWIFMAAEMDAQNRTHSRGNNKRFDIALEQAERRVARAREAKLHTGPIGGNAVKAERAAEGKSGPIINDMYVGREK